VVRFPETDTCPSAILIDELNAAGLDRFAYLSCGIFASTQFPFD